MNQHKTEAVRPLSRGSDEYAEQFARDFAERLRGRPEIPQEHRRDPDTGACHCVDCCVNAVLGAMTYAVMPIAAYPY